MSAPGLGFWFGRLGLRSSWLGLGLKLRVLRAFEFRFSGFRFRD